MKPSRLPDLYCPTCGEGWGGAAPAETHEYILNEWRRKHDHHMKTEPQDERANLPSASKLERIAECQGSVSLEQSLPEDVRNVVDLPDEQAERGIRIHKARETGNTIELNEEELETYKAGLKFENDLLIAWKDQYEIHRQQEHKEERIWLHDADLNPSASGKLDVFYLAAPYALICDWKSSFCTNLIPSPRNFQLRLQAVLVWQEYGATNIRVAFVKPKVKYENTDWCDYTEADLKWAQQQIEFILWQSRQEDAPRRAGRHCDHCPCKTICPEAGAYSMLPSVIASHALAITDKDTAYAAVGKLAPVDLVKIWESSTVVGHIIDAVKKRLKGMTAEELAALGLELTQGRKLDPITDVAGCVAFLTDTLGWPAEKVWGAMSISKTDLAEIAQQEKNLSQKVAAQWVNTALAEYITPARADGSLRRVK